MRSYQSIKCFQWGNVFKASIMSLILIFVGTTFIARADIYGLVDEPPMRSVSGSLHDIESIRVEAFLDGKWQTLSEQTALGFLILRNYVVYDNTSSSGFRTTDKYKQWKNNNSAQNTSNLNIYKWLGKTWKVRSDWGPGKSHKNTPWSFTVDNQNGACEVTVKGSKKFSCTIDQNNHLKWADTSGSPHKIVEFEFWLTANGTITGKFEGIGKDNKSFSGAYNAE